ncbi:MAG: O-antigen ligase family protein [Acidimicrobiia bacterium]
MVDLRTKLWFSRGQTMRIIGSLSGLLIVYLLNAIAWPSSALATDAEGTGATSSTEITVLVVTALAFVGAGLAVRQVRRSTGKQEDEPKEELLDVDLLDSRPAPASEPRITRIFETTFLVVLVGYALFDRGFAWFHVPGTPLFIGEITLGLGVLAMMATRIPMLSYVRRSPGIKALAIWMAWGFLFLVAQLPIYGIDTVRDSAIWYYGATALLVLFLVMADPGRLGRWADGFGRVMPYILGWFPIAIALDTILGAGPPYVPDSTVPFFTHRFGNIAVFSAISLGFVWLVDRERGRFSAQRRIMLTALATIAILLAGFQNRGGMVSAILGIVLMLFLLPRRRGELTLIIAAVGLSIATVAIVSDVRIPVSNGRDISAAQMMDNIGSIINPEGAESRQRSTTEWRLNLWSSVVNDVNNEHPVKGFGPGPDLGERYGVTTNEQTPLRNPHNSHVGVLARMGWVGIGMWAVLWSVWALNLLQLRSRLVRRGRSVEAGTIAWVLVSAFMILLNSVFDPTLEGPQVGMMLWVFFGIGASIPLLYAGLAGSRFSVSSKGGAEASGAVASSASS